MSYPTRTPGDIPQLPDFPRPSSAPQLLPASSSASSSSTSLRRSSRSSPNRSHVKRDRPHPAGPRVIRTFEEIKVPVKTEEWFEELECGICSQILGATQAIVPCGHTFCGPCLWQWLKQHTCPHCRVMVNEYTPFIANIIVDQIIDRKLQNLPESTEKEDMMIERKEKMQAWKAIQLRINPKPAFKRARAFDDSLPEALLQNVPEPVSRDRNGHQRRASRNLPALGQPIYRHEVEPFHQHDEDEARRATQSIQERIAQMNELREARLMALALQRAGQHPADMSRQEPISVPVLGGPLYGIRLRTPSFNHDQMDRYASNPPRGRYAPSSAPMRRQTRSRDDHGSRDDPLVVLSDSE
ncbi:hypothetical protein IAR55_007081 [Kwoniella newhampshirensis]|uniref:RING-type domain-containing protein n=1 Tax=Kwoniella newhampshirensis TaxID=1651941 RepID=A0AAW0YDJ2_9TREE